MSIMKRAVLGVRMHSGWGVVVAVSGEAGQMDVIDRRRIVTMDPRIPGANQPYHHAASLAPAEAERYIANCAAASERLAMEAVTEVLRELESRQFRVVASAILLASGRPLPALSKILESHALIHTAEGEFFRNAVRKACERLKIAVAVIRERELDERAGAALGRAAGRVQRRISEVGGSLGPPWAKDHKSASLAASMILFGRAQGNGLSAREEPR